MKKKIFEMKRSLPQTSFHNKNIVNKYSTVEIPKTNKYIITFAWEINKTNADASKLEIRIKRISENWNLTRQETLPEKLTREKSSN